MRNPICARLSSATAIAALLLGSAQPAFADCETDFSKDGFKVRVI